MHEQYDVGKERQSGMKNNYSIIKKTSIIVFFILSAIYIFSFLCEPFYDFDSTFYVLVGKGIFEHHLLPYEYIFEHKPFLVYIFYYIWSILDPVIYGRFAVLALMSIFIISYMCKKLYSTNFRITLLFIFSGSVSSYYLSGNTEVIQMPIQLLIAIMLCQAISEKNNYIFFAAGIISCISVNINYLSSLVVIPISMYVILFRLKNLHSFVAYFSGFFAALILILLPFIISGNGKLFNYFEMQHHFLHNYSANAKNRINTFNMVLINIIVIYPVIFSWFSNKGIFWSSDKNKILSLWFILSIFASIASGHTYYHYVGLFMVPAMIIATIVYEGNKLSKWMFLPIFLYSSMNMLYATIFNVNNIKNDQYINSNFISHIVGNNKVLNIRSDNSLYYLSNLETFDKFLFFDHVDYYFKENAENHYLEDLKEKPKFVLIPYRGCETDTIEHSICVIIQDKYHIVYTAYNHVKPKSKNIRYFELYEYK